MHVSVGSVVVCGLEFSARVGLERAVLHRRLSPGRIFEADFGPCQGDRRRGSHALSVALQLFTRHHRWQLTGTDTVPNYRGVK